MIEELRSQAKNFMLKTNTRIRIRFCNREPNE